MVATDQGNDVSGGALFALLRALRNRYPVVLVCVVLLPVAAYLFSASQTKEYSASASLLFRDPQLDQKLFGTSTFQLNVDPSREAATNLDLTSLPIVALRTSQVLHGAISPSQAESKVSQSAAGQSDVVTITATDHNPAFAAQLANTWGQQYIIFRRDADRSKIASAEQLVQQQLTSLPPNAQNGADAQSLRNRAEQLRILAALQTGNAELVQPATVPSSPSSPKPVRNAALGLLVGLLLGAGLALLLERLDRRPKDPKELADAFDRPVLGAIPISRSIAAADQNFHRLGAGEAEAFRMLRANMRYFNIDEELRSVLITSSAPGDGKSTVALNLAAAAADTGAKVLLIEADLRRPTLGPRLGIRGQRGLSQLLTGDTSKLSDVAHRVPVSTGRGADVRSMDVIVSGPIPPNPTDLIESHRMSELLRIASDAYDLVVVDTPPTSVVSDAIPLVKRVSGVIVVCWLGRTTRDAAEHLSGQLSNLNANTLGVVVNGLGRTGRYGGYGYGAYGYASEYAPAEPPDGAAKDEDLPPAEPVANGNGHGAVHALEIVEGMQAAEQREHSNGITAGDDRPRGARRGGLLRRLGGR